MAEEHDVFLSYNRQDVERAKQLAKDLRDHHITVWLDIESLHPGDEWILALEQALLGSRNYLFLMSNNTKDSVWIKREYAAAVHLCTLRNLSRRIIPVLLDDDVEIPLFITTLQCADLRKSSGYQTGMESLVESIRQDQPSPLSLPHDDRTLELHELIQLASKELVVSGLSLDMFTSADLVKKAIIRKSEDNRVKVVLILLNPYSTYAKAHEPFHRLESKGGPSAKDQILRSIEAFRAMAALRDEPPGFSVYLSQYMPRFRTVLIDEAICHVNLYMYGKDVGRTPEFVFRANAPQPEADHFASVNKSVRDLLRSPSVIPLISDGWFDKSWDSCAVQCYIPQCLEGLCTDRGHRTLARILTNGTSEEAHRLANTSFQALSVDRTLHFSPVEMVQRSFARLKERYSSLSNTDKSQVVNDVVTLWDIRHRQLFTALDETPDEEIEDLVDRLVLSVAFGHPEPNLPPSPEDLLVEDNTFLLLDWLERTHEPDLMDWLWLSVAAEKLAEKALGSEKFTTNSDQLTRIGRDLWRISRDRRSIDASRFYLHIISTNITEPLHVLCFPSTRVATVFTLRFYEELFRRSEDMRRGCLKLHLVPRAIAVGDYASFRDTTRFLARRSVSDGSPVSSSPSMVFDRLRDNLHAPEEAFERPNRRPEVFLYEEGPKRRAINLESLSRSLKAAVRNAFLFDVRGALSYRSLQGNQTPTFFGFATADDLQSQVVGLRQQSEGLIFAYHGPGMASFTILPTEHVVSASPDRVLINNRLLTEKAKWQGGPLSEFQHWHPIRSKNWEMTKEFYTFYGAEFHDIFGKEINPHSEDYVIKAITELARFHRLLILGCGSGKEAFEAWKHNPETRITAIDFSSEAILLAQRFCVDSGHPERKSAFMVGDYYALSEMFDQKFDAVIANAAFVHLLERSDLSRPILTSIYEVLNPGGLVWLRILKKSNLEEEVELRPPFRERPRPFVYYKDSDVYNAADSANFEVVGKITLEKHESRAAQQHDVWWVCAMLRKRDQAASSATGYSYRSGHL